MNQQYQEQLKFAESKKHKLDITNNFKILVYQSSFSYFTYEKILEINQNFMDNDVGEDMQEKIFMTITGDEHTALMQEEELISSDFNKAFVVEKGRIRNACGIDLIPFAAGVASPIIPVVSSQRQLVAASSRGICLGISKEMSIKIQERNDLIETTQVQVVFEIGAVRTEGALVQKVTVTA